MDINVTTELFMTKHKKYGISQRQAAKIVPCQICQKQKLKQKG
jgi:hypothetical protein